MAEEFDEVPGEQVPAQPSPQLQSPTGLTTSSGQFTAIFGLLALLLGFLGFKYSPEQIENWVELINKLLMTLGPIIAAVPVLITYINSRGKIASNTLNANATILAAKESVPLGEPLLMSHGFVDDRFSKVIGGDDWKDPERYENIFEIAGALGVPGASRVKDVNDKFHVGDLLKGILSAVKHKKDN